MFQCFPHPFERTWKCIKRSLVRSRNVQKHEQRRCNLPMLHSSGWYYSFHRFSPPSYIIEQKNEMFADQSVLRVSFALLLSGNYVLMQLIVHGNGILLMHIQTVRNTSTKSITFEANNMRNTMAFKQIKQTKLGKKKIRVPAQTAIETARSFV